MNHPGLRRLSLLLAFIVVAHATEYFNDMQHTRKIGAQLNAAAVTAGLRDLKDCPLAGCLLP